MIKKTFIIYLFSIIFFSCNGKIESDLYLRDLIDAEKNIEECIMTKAVIGFESPSEENKEKVINFIKQNFREVSNVREKPVDYSTYLYADIKIPIKNIQSPFPKDLEDLFYIIVKKENDNINFGIGLNQNVFIKIKKYVSDEFWQTLDIDNWSFKIIFNNDTRENYNLNVNCCYINNYPYPFSHTIEFFPRDNLEIFIPDVLRDYAYNKGETIFGYLILK